MAGKKKDDDFSFEILEHYENLTEKTDKNWQRQLNLVSWNGGEAKYDIRDWHIDENGKPDRCGKGISLTYEEMCLVCQAGYDKGLC